MSEIHKIDDSHVKFELTIEPKVWEKFWKEAIQLASKQVNIKGFRPGHAPEAEVVEKVGESAIKNEALSQALTPVYMEFAKTNKIEPIAQPKITIKTWEPSPVVEIEVAIKPEIDLKKIEGVKVKMDEVKVADKDVNKTIADLKNRFKGYKKVDRASKEGDRLEIDFAGQTPDGVALDGTQSKNHPVVLGQAQLLPDFEKQLFDRKTGEEFEFTMQFPKDYHGKNVAGKDVVFKVKVNQVEEGVEPQDDELGKKIFGTEMKFADLKKRIHDDMEKAAKNEVQHKAEDEAARQIATKIKDVPLPDEMITAELGQLRREREAFFKQRGADLETYLKQTKQTPEKYEEKLKEEATYHVRLRLIFDQIMQTEKPQLTDEQKKELEKQLKTVPAEHQVNFRHQRVNQLIIQRILSRFIS